MESRWREKIAGIDLIFFKQYETETEKTTIETLFHLKYSEIVIKMCQKCINY